MDRFLATVTFQLSSQIAGVSARRQASYFGRFLEEFMQIEYEDVRKLGKVLILSIG